MKWSFRAIAAAVGVFALALQYWLVANQPSGPDLITWTINFFSFFTILTNTLAACAMLLPLIVPNTAAGRLFVRPSVRTAIAGYIIIVGAVYFLILRHTWDPNGWNLIADQLLHYVTPTLFVIDWLCFEPKGQVPWRHIGWSLVFPIAYMVWTLVHGELANWYPYPFVDVTKLGYPAVMKNIGGFLGVVAGVAIALVILDRTLGSLQRRDATSA